MSCSSFVMSIPLPLFIVFSLGFGLLIVAPPGEANLRGRRAPAKPMKTKPVRIWISSLFFCVVWQQRLYFPAAVRDGDAFLCCLVNSLPSWHDDVGVKCLFKRLDTAAN